jgi:hypothetical protein
MENFVRKDTVGKIEEIDAKYELLQRGQYAGVAPNDTAAGRQLNRRVEMVVAGDVIGIPIGPSSNLQRR